MFGDAVGNRDQINFDRAAVCLRLRGAKWGHQLPKRRWEQILTLVICRMFRPRDACRVLDEDQVHAERLTCRRRGD